MTKDFISGFCLEEVVIRPESLSCIISLFELEKLGHSTYSCSVNGLTGTMSGAV